MIKQKYFIEMNHSPTGCAEIERLLRQPLYQISSCVQLAIVSAIFVSTFTLIRHCWVHKLTIHGNLMILLTNLTFLYFLNAAFYGASIVRYQILFRLSLSSSNCELLLTPVWLALLLASPPYLYLVANPFLHFFIMVERCRATLSARHYENVRLRFGWLCAAISWVVALSAFSFVIVSDLSDPFFARPLALVTLTTEKNARGIIWLHFAILFLLIVTSVGYCLLKFMNNNLLNRPTKFGSYSVSRNYQIRENLLTIRLLFPLDLSYAILFGIFLLIGLTLRFYRAQMSPEIYVSIYNSATTLLLLHSAITLVIYNKFIKCASTAFRRKNVRVKPLAQLTDAHFNQLKNQWNAGGKETQKTNRIL